MNRLTTFSIVLLLAILANGCRKNNTDTATPANPITGAWKISSFIKDSVDLTSQFNGITFTCDNHGNMTIHDNSHDYSCNWNNNGDESMCHFHIMGCDDNSILWELEEDWDVTYPDNQHCNFTSHSPHNHCTMQWTKI